MGSVLIVGGMGFVGSHTAVRFAEAGYQVIALDRQLRSVDYLDRLGPKLTRVQGDVLSFEELEHLVREYDIEGIVDCFAYIDPKNPREVLHANLQSAINILEIARTNALKVVNVSSACVYGAVGHQRETLSEETPFSSLGPLGPYDSPWGPMHATTRRTRDALADFYAEAHGVDVVTVRTSALYGSGDTKPISIYEIIEKAVDGVEFEREKGGDRAVDYTHVKDVAEGNFLAYAVRPLPHRLYNIGAGVLCSMGEMAQTVRDLIPGARIRLGPGIVPGYPLISYFRGPLDCSRARRELGFSPEYNLRDGLRDVIQWYRDNPGFRIFHGSDRGVE